ncbi:heterocyst frequency control protein PatD [Leptolyngbya sp. PCC 6406]|uniref:heterocyst frequency control protein PatD n=1 Tax=Leptolyngbya sp. PCC 6406 TaxID=1173264 RepID=UPI0002AC3C13|nr:heterocyst frequency control protein PatD [Leptolyngbya sp. PCC 6406]
MAPADDCADLRGSPRALVTTFMDQVQRLRQTATQPNPDGRSLQEQFLALQQSAQQGILQMTPRHQEGLPPQSVVAYQTEISRALRLLGMDITFMQAARQSLTGQKRQAQMGDRLERLLNYGEGLLASLSDDAVGTDGN